MKILTKQIKAYNFLELSDEAKDNIRYNESLNFYENITGQDYLETLKEFCNELNISWREYDVNPAFIDYQSHIKNSDLKDYKDNGIQNDIFYKLTVLKNSSDCPLTGVYTDEDILEPIRQLKFTKKFQKEFYSNFDYEGLIQKCMNSWLKALVKAYEYEQSDEYLNELATANDYLYTEQGKLI